MRLLIEQSDFGMHFAIDRLSEKSLNNDDNLAVFACIVMKTECYCQSTGNSDFNVKIAIASPLSIAI